MMKLLYTNLWVCDDSVVVQNVMCGCTSDVRTYAQPNLSMQLVKLQAVCLQNPHALISMCYSGLIEAVAV